MQRPRTNSCLTHANSAINSDINTDIHCNNNNSNNNSNHTSTSSSTSKSITSNRFVSIAIVISALTLASSPLAVDAFAFTANSDSRATSTRRSFQIQPSLLLNGNVNVNPPTTSTTTSALSMLEKSVYERDSNGNQVMSQTYTSNTEAQASSHVMKKRIVKLLSDDHGEEDDEIPDYSLEAANEIADKRVYSKISEEAKWKANAVMQKSEVEAGTGPGLHVNANDLIETKVIARKSKPVTKVMASVKETGGDSIGEYVKSIGSHELLPQESEMLLGRHIQLLVTWEKVRGGLEDDLDRYVLMILDIDI